VELFVDSISYESNSLEFSLPSASQSGLIPIFVACKKARMALNALGLLKSLNLASLSSFLGLATFEFSNSV
jgi:hypothetical protein